MRTRRNCRILRTLALLFIASTAWSCRAAPPARDVAPESPPAALDTRWGDIRIVRRDLLGDAVVAHGGTLHTGDDLAIRIKLRRPAFARIVNLDASGRTAFEADLGRVTAVAETIRIPADDYLHLDSVLGTEYVVLMLSEAPLEPAGIEALRQSVLRADPSANARARERKPSKPLREAKTKEEAAPHRELGLRDRGMQEGRGPYFEVEGGRNAATWIRFEHRSKTRAGDVGP